MAFPSLLVREWLVSPAFSSVVSVMKQGRVLIECARGFANRGTQELNHLATRFTTASNRKPEPLERIRNECDES